MRILVCEDDEATRRLVELNMKPRGHYVDGAGNVPDAIRMFDQAQASGEPYDLLIIDIRLPGPSGYSLAGHARGAGYEGRIAVLTGEVQEIGNLAHIKAEFWPKPEALKYIIDRIEAHPCEPNQ